MTEGETRLPPGHAWLDGVRGGRRVKQIVQMTNFCLIETTEGRWTHRTPDGRFADPMPIDEATKSLANQFSPIV